MPNEVGDEEKEWWLVIWIGVPILVPLVPVGVVREGGSGCAARVFRVVVHDQLVEHLDGHVLPCRHLAGRRHRQLWIGVGGLSGGAW